MNCPYSVERHAEILSVFHGGKKQALEAIERYFGGKSTHMDKGFPARDRMDAIREVLRGMK